MHREQTMLLLTAVQAAQLGINEVPVGHETLKEIAIRNRNTKATFDSEYGIIILNYVIN